MRRSAAQTESVAVEWGDVPTWVNAAVTGAALWAAYRAVKASGQMLKIEQKRDAKRDAEDRDRRQQAEAAEQADKVAAWPEERPDEFGKFAEPTEWGTRLVNGSALPVYNVESRQHAPDGKVLWSTADHVLAPTDPEGKFHSWPGRVREVDGVDGPVPPELCTVSISFRDSGGRRWKRDLDGRLLRPVTEQRSTTWNVEAPSRGD